MTANNDPNRVPASLYEEGEQLHKHSKDQGYTMNPASQGMHGKYTETNKLKCDTFFSLDNIKPAYVWIVAGGLAAAGAGYLGYKWYAERNNSKSKKKNKKKTAKANL